MWVGSSLRCYRLCAGLISCLLATGAVADTIACPGTTVSVIGETAQTAKSLCKNVQHSLDTLTSCNVHLTHPVTVRLRRTLPTGCMGLYHCGDERIELLALEAMEAARDPGNSLAFVDNETYFQSILTHELAHAAFEDVPCPFDHCMATSEYLAHVMQVRSLPAADIARFEAELDMETHVGRDAVNSMIYAMAPDVFLRRAWIHLNQRPDACAYIDAIMQGHVIHDHERFE